MSSQDRLSGWQAEAPAPRSCRRGCIQVGQALPPANSPTENRPPLAGKEAA